MTKGECFSFFFLVMVEACDSMDGCPVVLKICILDDTLDPMMLVSRMNDIKNCKFRQNLNKY